MSDGDNLRARGNALYSEGRFDDARDCYTRAITALLSTAESDGAAGHVAIAQLYSNRAQCSIQQRDFALALQDAARALEHDADNEKAQLRRLVALENLERFETAFQLVERVLDAHGARESHPTLFDYAVKARRRLRKTIQQDVAVAREEGHAVGRMVHDNQQLRINFGCLLPTHVPIGQFFDITINIGNEFGLFRRDYLAAGERIKLQCSLRNNDDSQFKLVFREARVPTEDPSAHTPPVDGIITLNDRGKAVFEMAIDHAQQQPVDSRSNMALTITVHPDDAAKWSLLSIVSLPFTVFTDNSDMTEPYVLEDEQCSALGIHCCRPVWLPTLNREILLAESPGNLGIGGKLWDSCLVLTRYLARHKDELHGKQVVELGSGLGLVGMFCALLGARHVTLTDISEVVPLLDYNIRLNFHASDDDRPRAVEHWWGTSIDTLPPHPDAVVLSDVVYDPEGYVPLVTSLRALAATKNTTIFMAHRSRNPMEHQFFDLLAQSFDYELVDWAGEEREQAVEAGDVAGKDERALQDVKIFRISRRI